MARIRFPPRRVWWTSNVPLSAIHRTGVVISRRTSSGSSTAWLHSSHSADIFLLDSIRTTSRRAWVTPIILPKKQFQPAAEPRRTDVAGIADLHPLHEICYDEFNADVESDDSSDLCGAEGKSPISLRQTEFYLKQFAKTIGQPHCGAFNQCNKVWVAGFLEKKHPSIIPGQNCLKHQRDRPLH